MRYAMICKNRVILILENQPVEPKLPPDDKGNAVTAISCDETVEIGMIYDADTGKFSPYKAPKHIPDQLTRIERMLRTSKTEVENAAIDSYTEELIEGGLL